MPAITTQRAGASGLINPPGTPRSSCLRPPRLATFPRAPARAAGLSSAGNSVNIPAGTLKRLERMVSEAVLSPPEARAISTAVGEGLTPAEPACRQPLLPTAVDRLSRRPAQ